MINVKHIASILLRIALIASPFAAIAFGSIYWQTSKVVAHRLALNNHGSFSVVYSRPTIYEAGVPISHAGLLSRLKRRDYKAVQHRPSRPGEYNCTSTECTIQFRQPQLASGFRNPPLATLRFKDGRITDDQNQLIYRVALEPVVLSPLGQGEVRAVTRLSLDEIPKQVVDALLATEDQRFYSHWGIDPIGIARAMTKNIMAGAWVEGGSTITQQLAKNLLLSPRKTISRKIKELFAALNLEQQLSKEQILTMYLNEVYFSQEGSIAVHGIQEASRTFFAKDAKDLELHEAALLIGLIKAPSYYSPRRHPSRAASRRNVVIDNMQNLNLITAELAETAKSKPLKLAPSIFRQRRSPYFMAHLEKELEHSFQIEANPRSGLQVNSFIDELYQECAETAVSATLQELRKRYPATAKDPSRELQQALVSLDAETGAVLAWVGGREYSKNQFDHVAQARRQIGSTIKPFLYLTALDPSLNDYKVATAVSILGDEPTGITLVNQNTWHPENFDHKYRGDVTLRYALEKSLNIPAVYVAQRVGIQRIKATLERFKVTSSAPAVPALALGAVETSLLELTSSFGALARLGKHSSPRIFKNVVDPDGNLLAALPQLTTTVNDPGPVFLVVDMMRGVIVRGTGRSALAAGFNHPAAGKTGTSDSSRDAWFVGFTPKIVTGVWTGFDDNSKTGLTGGGASAPTWGKYMQCISPHLQKQNFAPPATVRMVTLDRRNRKPFYPDCSPPEQFRTQEIFLRGTEPSYSCYGKMDSEIEPERPPRHRELQSRRDRDRDTGFWDSLFDW